MIDTELIAEHDFGSISSGTKRATLSGIFTPPSSGLYNLEIRNTRSVASSTCIYNYIDNISIMPWNHNLSADTINIPCETGCDVNFKLKAGGAQAGKDYWLLFNCSGTYPGITLNGINIPLNMDALFLFGLHNPGLPGTVGFVGQLDGTGKASASVAMPIDRGAVMIGLPISFAYVLLSPGPSTLITYSSIPVHIKYIP